MARLIIEADQDTTQQELIELAEQINCDVRLASDGKTLVARPRKVGTVVRVVRPDSKTALMEKADAFREEWGHTGGYVVFCKGQIAGWKRFLDHPSGWEPGCIALDDQGKKWITEGGDNYQGSLRWAPVGQGDVVRMPARVREVRQPGPGAA